MCYVTGDWAKWHNGELIYHGRQDSQIKVAGNRVDLNEIQKLLSQHQTFKVSPVLLFDDGKVLAFYQRDDDSAAASSPEALAKWLPTYAIPVFVCIDEIPLLPVSGKVDRRALLSQYRRKSVTQLDNTASLTGLSDMQKHRLDIFLDVFQEQGLQTSPIDDVLESNFFQIGGTSRNAVATIRGVNARGLLYDISHLLAATSVRELVFNTEEGTPDQSQHGVKCAEILREKKWTIKPITKDNIGETVEMVARNFTTHEMLFRAALCGDEEKRKMMETDMAKVLHAFVPYVLRDDPQEYLSFGLYDDRTGQVLGIYLNYAEEHQPNPNMFPADIPDVMEIAGVMMASEGPVMEFLRGQGHERVFNAFCLAIEHSNLPNPLDRVAAVIALEHHAVEVAQDRKFQSIVVCNSARLTQDCGEAVVGYTTFNVVRDLKHIKSHRGDSVFPGAADTALLKGCYKILV